MKHDDPGEDADLILQLLKAADLYRTDFGLITSPGEGDSGRYFLLAETPEEGTVMGSGVFYLEERRGICSEFDALLPVDPGEMEELFNSPDLPYFGPVIWEHPQAELADPVPWITAEEMTVEMRDSLPSDIEYVETDDFSPEFYRRQAALGFIAVARRRGGKTTLLPELQRFYAVLDWQHLIVEQGVAKILDGLRIGEEGIRLSVEMDPGTVLSELEEAWGASSWLLPGYCDLIQRLASEDERKADTRFRIWATVLYAGNSAAAGELGYSIGLTYTSLSGFFHRERREWNHFGKLQMVLLARHLRDNGMDFWNLGHPYMEYKRRLGAEVLPRNEFLKRWDASVNLDTPDLSL